MAHRRGRHEIVMAILSSAKNGIKKTNIMYRARLGYDQLEKYLGALKKGGFIAEESGVWKTTEKGNDAIEACQICHDLVMEIP